MHADEDPALDADVMEALRHLDHVPPRITADDIAARAAPGHTRYQWAAGLLLAAAIAGTAMAAPGSPLRGWLRGVFRAEPAPAPPSAVPDTPMAGIAVVPGPALVIEFTALQDLGTARVTLIEGDQVQVSAPRDAASFSSGPARLVIENRGASDFEIGLPRAAPYIAIRVAGTTVLRKEANRVILSRGTAAPAVWNVPLTAPR